jgi:transglutaminase-like putative cysteine protease
VTWVKAESTVRQWLLCAALLGQMAAFAAGVLPPMAVLLALAATTVATKVRAAPGGVWARLTPVFGLAIGAGVAVRAVAGASAATATGLSGMLLTLTTALVLLIVVMAPSWHRPRDYWLWLCIDAAILVAAAAEIPRPLSSLPLVAGCLTLVAAGSVVQAWAVSTVADTVASTPADASMASGWRRSARAVGTPVLVASAIGALVYAALPSGLGGGGLSTRLAHMVSPPTQPQLTRAMVGVDTTGSGFLDLRTRGSLPKTPLLRVPADSPPLWRGAVYDNYDGAMWVPDTERGTVFRGADVTLAPNASNPMPVGVARTDVVHEESTTVGALVWAPGVIRRVRADMSGLWLSSASTRIFGHPADGQYVVTSVVPTTDPSVLATATGADDADPTWTGLPAELPARVADLARQITAGAGTRYAQVQAIERYLRGHETYTLNSPVPGPGQDAVDRFLFRDHVGFCEQFASAATVLLRTLHVPARVVSGLAYGHQVGDGERLFTAADAHAWVEVYYPGVGWVPTDPTAGVRLAATVASHRSGPLAWVLRVRQHVPGGLWAPVTVLLVAIGIAVFVIVRRRRRRARPTVSAGRVLEAFFALVRRAHRPRGDAETVREYVERVARDADLADAVSTLERECYGDSLPDAAAVDDAVADFQTVDRPQ